MMNKKKRELENNLKHYTTTIKRENGESWVCTHIDTETKEHDEYISFCKRNKVCTKLGCYGEGFPYCVGHDM